MLARDAGREMANIRHGCCSMLRDRNTPAASARRRIPSRVIIALAGAAELSIARSRARSLAPLFHDEANIGDEKESRQPPPKRCRYKNVGDFWTSHFAAHIDAIDDDFTTESYAGDERMPMAARMVERHISFPSLLELHDASGGLRTISPNRPFSAPKRREHDMSFSQSRPEAWRTGRLDMRRQAAARRRAATSIERCSLTGSRHQYTRSPFHIADGMTSGITPFTTCQKAGPRISAGKTPRTRAHSLPLSLSAQVRSSGRHADLPANYAPASFWPFDASR